MFCYGETGGMNRQTDRQPISQTITQLLCTCMRADRGKQVWKASKGGPPALVFGRD